METHTPPLRSRSQKLGIGGLALLACIAVALIGLVCSPRAAHAAVGDYGTLEDGTYVISSYSASTQGYSRLWDVYNAGKSDGTKVVSYHSDGTGAQRWRITTDSDGYSTIVNAQSGKALDVPGGTVANGKQLQIYTSNGSKAQKWKIIERSSAYKIVSAVDESYVIDLNSASTDDFTAIQLYQDNSTSAQRWTFEKVAEDALNISSEQTEMFDTSVYITDAQGGSFVVEDLPDGWIGPKTSGKDLVCYYAAGLYTGGSDTIKVRYDKIGKVNGQWVSVRLTFSNLKATKISPTIGALANNSTGIVFYANDGFWNGLEFISLDQADVTFELLDYSTGSPISLKGSFIGFGSLNYGSSWGTEGVGYRTSNDYNAYLLENHNLRRESSGIWNAVSTDGWKDKLGSDNYNLNSVSFGIVDDAPRFRFVFPNNDEAMFWTPSFSPLTAAIPPSPTKSVEITE